MLKIDIFKSNSPKIIKYNNERIFSGNKVFRLVEVEFLGRCCSKCDFFYLEPNNNNDGLTRDEKSDLCANHAGTHCTMLEQVGVNNSQKVYKQIYE